MTFTRRALLATPALAWARPRFKVGVMDGIILKPSDAAAVGLARDLGFDGIQVTLGRQTTSGHLLMANPGRQRAVLAASKLRGVPVVSTYLDILHIHCLKNDREAVRRAVEGIEVTRRLAAPILMLVFFGECALETRGEMDAVIAPLKELAREAERAQVILGFENTIRAADDLRILDAVGSPALQVYYDIGNATNLYKVDPAAEIRQLGRSRICQFHFKDKGYLGEGAVDAGAALRAIGDIGWQGYIVLETASPSGDRPADARRNLAALHRLLDQ